MKALAQFPPINCYMANFLKARAEDVKLPSSQAARTSQEADVNTDTATNVKEPRKPKKHV
jgi:hypothetical protein